MAGANTPQMFEASASRHLILPISAPLAFEVISIAANTRVDRFDRPLRRRTREFWLNPPQSQGILLKRNPAR